MKKESIDSKKRGADIQTPLKKQEHFIIAIGASAGGLEAIHAFFDNATENNNVSYIVIQHLSPDYKSLLVELVSKHTNMNVFEAKNGMKVEKSCIYVIPPKKILTIAGGKLQLSEKESHNKAPNTAIDTFLYTLAHDQTDKAIAIILSGTGTDGTRGIEAIKEAGGIVMVQDPESAKFDGMPRSAISSGCADYVLTPQQMPAEITNLIQEIPYNIFNKGQLDENLLNEIFKLIHKNTDCDFRNYKLPTLLRRISRRMQKFGFKVIDDYLQYLYKHPEECHALCKDFLIGVTRFFRDSAAFETLEKNVIPTIIKEKKEDEAIKVWVTACSTGEEAYSIAILLDQCLKSTGKLLNVKIFATDIDSNAIEIASRGEYSNRIEKELPAYILDNYFIKKEKKYVVIPEIRKQIVFAKHNIIKDPPFIKNDFVSCRNMLIYMDALLQKKVLSTLLFSLNSGGYLFLGSSETISSFRDNLKEIDRKWKIYKKGDKTAKHPIVNLDRQVAFASYPNERTIIPQRVLNPVIAKGLNEDFKNVVAEENGYAALYIDKNYEIKEATGDFHRYLSLPERSINLNVLRMTNSDLSAILGTAIRQAWKEERKVTIKNISVRDSKKIRSVSIIVKPTLDTQPYTLIVLSENELQSAPKATIDLTTVSNSDGEYIAELKAELQETKLNLQTAIEGLETANEELQSSNEELLSSNEELQSSNEELQSLNEELHTLNTEHQMKINELIELNDDLDNYFRSTDIGQVFLDKHLKIRKFNPAAVKLINLIEADIDRPINHISTNIRDENLTTDIDKVIRLNTILEKEVKLSNGKTSLMRIYPYIRQDKQIDGVVITFVDISALKNLNNIINGVFNVSKNAIIAFKAVRNSYNKIIDFTWLAVNETAEMMYEKTKQELIDHNLVSLFPEVVQQGLFDKFVAVVERDVPLRTEQIQIKDNKVTYWEVVAAKMMDGLAVTYMDITEKRGSEELLRNNYNELIATKDKLKKLNQELENKIIERTNRLSLSEERFRLVSRATNDAILDWDLVNNTIWLSDSFYKMFGYTKDDKPVRRKFLLDKIHPEDKKRISDSIAKAINSNSKQWAEEYRFLKADGNYANILDRGYILHDENGTPYRMLNSMLDVSELRRAKQEVISNIQQREFLAEAIPMIVWTATPVGKVIFFNQQFTAYTGLSIKDGIEFGWRRTIHPNHLPLLSNAWKNAFRHKTDFSIEVKLLKSDGNYYWHLLRARARKDVSGHLLMWVGTSTDIHEQKMATNIMEQQVNMRTIELRKANEDLEASNHDLQQFASVASHDLKEPLRKIHMFSNMLKDKYLKDIQGADDYIDRIISSSSRMTKLINDLLSFSRLSVNTLFEPVNMNVLINEILSDLELAINEKEATIHVDELPVIDAVPGQLRQVFQNIISNALKFSRKDVKPVITIRASRITAKKFNSNHNADGKYLRIEVSDNGIGFDEKYLDKIFTIFQRLHTKQEYEGTGIGLAICKKIIDKHDGIITAESVEGQGTTFIIVLPVQHSEEKN